MRAAAKRMRTWPLSTRHRRRIEDRSEVQFWGVELYGLGLGETVADDKGLPLP